MFDLKNEENNNNKKSYRYKSREEWRRFRLFAEIDDGWYDESSGNVRDDMCVYSMRTVLHAIFLDVAKYRQCRMESTKMIWVDEQR